ncbi:MAG: hypothetical protein FJ138_06900 [Deltaproteobacteria bacterium]|nr:hypothetical protein [Deltaproteobacteria bacterium]
MYPLKTPAATAALRLSLRAALRAAALSATAVAPLALSACGASQTQLAGEMKLGEAKDASAASAAVEAGDALWAARGDRAKAEEAIKRWEEAAALDPTQASTHLKLSYAYYFIANVHVRWEEESEDAQGALFDKGVKAGERAILAQNPDFKKALETQKWEEAVTQVSKEGIASLYWYATNLGKWSLLQGIGTTLGNKPRIKSTMDQVLKLDETFYHGAPHRYFGVYEAKVPFGDIAKSGASFDKAIELAPLYLDTKVLKAEYFAAKQQDEELFKKLLGEVIAADPKAIPDLEVENTNSQRIAKKMLDNISDFF